MTPNWELLSFFNSEISYPLRKWYVFTANDNDILERLELLIEKVVRSNYGKNKKKTKAGTELCWQPNERNVINDGISKIGGGNFGPACINEFIHGKRDSSREFTHNPVLFRGRFPFTQGKL